MECEDFQEVPVHGYEGHRRVILNAIQWNVKCFWGNNRAPFWSRTLFNYLFAIVRSFRAPAACRLCRMSK